MRSLGLILFMSLRRFLRYWGLLFGKIIRKGQGWSSGIVMLLRILHLFCSTNEGMKDEREGSKEGSDSFMSYFDGLKHVIVMIKFKFSKIKV